MCLYIFKGRSHLYWFFFCAQCNGHECIRRRISCLRLHLERTLKRSSIPKYITTRLENMSRYTGIFRYKCGLLSNYVISRRLEQGLDPSRINKRLYDMCWAAIKCKIDDKKTTNDLSALLDDLIQETDMDIYSLPRTVSRRLQVTVTKRMETSATISVIIHLESNIKGFIKFKLVNDPQTGYGDLSKKDQSTLVKSLSEACLNRNLVLNTVDERHKGYEDQVRVCLHGALSTDLDKPILKVLKITPHLFQGLISMICGVEEGASVCRGMLGRDCRPKTSQPRHPNQVFRSSQQWSMKWIPSTNSPGCWLPQSL